MRDMAELVEKCKQEMDRQLAELLRAHGIDPDDRSEGWEERAREVFRGYDIGHVEEVNCGGPDGQMLTASVTIQLRPKTGR